MREELVPVVGRGAKGVTSGPVKEIETRSRQSRTETNVQKPSRGNRTSRLRCRMGPVDVTRVRIRTEKVKIQDSEMLTLRNEDVLRRVSRRLWGTKKD